jgi:hypothetical protein
MSRMKTCFVVMPFGVKSYAGGKMNFDDVFAKYVSAAADLAGYKAERADMTDQGGVINKRMMELIYHCPMAVVDITTNNPNVFYELGVRHALHKRGTVLIRRRGSGNAEVSAFSRRRSLRSDDIPFNIRNMKVFDYELDGKENLLTSPQTLVEKIIAAEKGTHIDSLPYEHLPELKLDIRKKPATGIPKTVQYRLPDRPSATIGYRTGDIKYVNDIDFWVNSENVMMQMARFYEQSISSTIRYLGALQPDPTREGFDDTIAKALFLALGNRGKANDAEVLVTDSGLLASTHKVKKILHVAAARGYPGKGWEPLKPELLGECVENVIVEARKLVRRPEDPVAGQSILIPLLGTGQARGEPDRICGILLQAAIDALNRPPPFLPSPAEGDINDVLFLAFSESDEQMLERLLDNLQQEGSIGPPVT